MTNKEFKAVLVVGAILALSGVVIHFIFSVASFIEENILFILSAIFLFVSPYFGYFIYKNLYFNSEGFKKTKEDIKKYTDNCNSLNKHIEDLKQLKSNFYVYDYGSGSFHDESNYGFKRVEWANIIKNKQVYNCSSVVCKNASNQPFKYLIKYFNIDVNENSLSIFENMLNNFSSVSEGRRLLLKEKNQLIERIKNNIPSLIMKYSRNELIRKLGFDDVDLSKSYFPVYSFQYVSSGGNSQYRFDVHLNEDNLEKLINYMAGLISFKKSIVGQRQLMTKQLRNKIKIRDDYTCQSCHISIKDEKNLLLEIDHIIPLSKGGLTEDSNLQTLCWRCNRSKGSRIL